MKMDVFEMGEKIEPQQSVNPEAVQPADHRDIEVGDGLVVCGKILDEVAPGQRARLEEPAAQQFLFNARANP